MASIASALRHFQHLRREFHKSFEIILKKCFSVGLWWDFQSFFNRMPIAGLISKRVLCMHGGLSPHLTSLEQIRQIKRPCEPLVSAEMHLLCSSFF